MRQPTTRKTLERIIDHSDDRFMDKLMFLVDRNSDFKNYLEHIVDYNVEDLQRRTTEVQ